MTVWTSRAIRRCFVDYFKLKHNHQWIPSSSIQPENDPTILFTTAGMSQFRDIFTGDINCDHPFANLKRACSYQKCIRTGGKHDDLKEVGYDYRHHTFFEMLGNWSFGDYFKEEACKMALDLLVNEFKIPKDRLVITFFGGDSELGIPCDEETREIWLALGFQKDKVIPLGKSENFWEMGYVGPCGICSEIHYLMDGNCHQDPSKLLHNSLEIWNLVFMQYNRLKDGSLTPLSKNHVDTGMGLERINSVLNNVPSNYDTDGFIPLMELLQRETKAPPYRGSLTDPMDIAYRIVTDHIRMITVSLSDGLVPASRDAGYQFRRIFRRCYFHLVDEFRTKQPANLIATLCRKFADLIGDDYPEIPQNIENVCKTVKRESLLVNFLRKKTYQKFQELANDKKLQQKNFINGQETFSLFMEGAGSKWLLNRLAKQMDMVIDWEGFEKLFDEHKIKSAEGLEKVKNT